MKKSQRAYLLAASIALFTTFALRKTYDLINRTLTPSSNTSEILPSTLYIITPLAVTLSVLVAVLLFRFTMSHKKLQAATKWSFGGLAFTLTLYSLTLMRLGLAGIGLDTLLNVIPWAIIGWTGGLVLFFIVNATSKPATKTDKNMI